MMTDTEIYEAYPRHVARIAAIKAIQRAVRELSRSMGEKLARETIYTATCAYARSPAGTRPERQFIPHPATWFNQGRYLDDPEEWSDHATHQQSETRNDRILREALAGLDDQTPQDFGRRHPGPRTVQ